MVFTDNVNILSGSVHTVRKSTKALVVASKQHTGLEGNADKTKYMVISRDQNAGPIHSIKIDNNFFERVEQFNYLGTILRHLNSIREKIKNGSKSGNSYYNSMRNFFFTC